MNVSNIYFYHNTGEIIFKNIFNNGKITNKIDDDKYLCYFIISKKEIKPILNRSQYEDYINTYQPNILAQYCIMFPKENPYLYIEEFKNNYHHNENKMEELKYNLVDQIVSDSKLLRQMQKEDDIEAFISSFNIDVKLLFKFYEGIFDLNESEVYKLIDYLDYLDNDKLLDILTYAVYKNISLANYYNKLLNQLGENGEFRFSDNLTRLENFNGLLINGDILKYKSYFSFIIENQVSLAKYFFWDFYNKDNIFYIFKTIFKYSNDNTLLLWIMDELNIELDFDLLLRSLVFNKFFFDNILPEEKQNTDTIGDIFREGSLDSIKFLYENYFDFMNHSITKNNSISRNFEDILYDILYDNNNSIEILTWIKEKYPTELYEFFVYSDYFENIFNVFRNYNKNSSYYLDFIIWVIDNYPSIIIDYIEIILEDISSKDNDKVKYILSKF